ncbi:MAG: ABC transporter ATP-binding protein [Deltaproteobacteria bacterium]|nr:ABC transporter ATP-binding protein [Deltaproteobacteria bacterium]MBW2615625.1 ABC transporter ATP-binding protein [Deltaproteobacteria bacterium]
MLKLTDIRKTYKIGPVDVEVLKGVVLEVKEGELLSVMGTSGCGKSTLMNIIGMLDKPSSGTHLLEGREVSNLSDNEISSIRNNKIGFVFQAFYLLPRLTSLENVGVPLIYRGMKKSEIRRRSHEFLKKVGMDDRAQHKPNELSGGQQQRVAIARALVGKPSIILADEPTGALDSQVGKDIMQLFADLNSEEGITVIIITHDPKIAQQCRRSVRMQDGVIIDD